MMRKFLTLLLIAIVTGNLTHAQIKKGAVLLGGQVAVEPVGRYVPVAGRREGVIGARRGRRPRVCC